MMNLKFYCLLSEVLLIYVESEINILAQNFRLKNLRFQGLDSIALRTFFCLKLFLFLWIKKITPKIDVKSCCKLEEDALASNITI